MKKEIILSLLFLALIIMIFIFAIRKYQDDNRVSSKKHYLNEYVTVVDKYPPTMVHSGKYMVEVKKLLVRRVTDTTLYAELGCNDWFSFKHGDGDYYRRSTTYFDSLYYNTPIGGKLYFKWIYKSRFFHINKY